MARLYHPALGREIEVPDDEGCIAVHAESGWLPAPEPEVRPGYEPEPVTYTLAESGKYAQAPAEAPKAKRGSKTESVKGEDPTPD